MSGPHTAPSARRILVATPHGEASVDLDLADRRLLLVIGHGAGGNVDSPDLLAVRRSCLQRGISVARVTQPYRLAGRKAPPPAATLDAAWQAVLANLAAQPDLAGIPVVTGGRSSGARVACRCSNGSVRGVVALAFPLHPPGKPEKSRATELDAIAVPVLIVQGERDPFGQPDPAADRVVVTVPGDHSLRQSADQVGDIVADWLLPLV